MSLCVSACLSVWDCLSIFSTTVGQTDVTLGMCNTVDPSKCSVSSEVDPCPENPRKHLHMYFSGGLSSGGCRARVKALV